MLADVVSHGTGSTARAAGFRLPAAGKTGTTDDFNDAWFIGYTPHLAAGVWFGFDKPATIMREGFAGAVAAPAWGQFMRVATAGARPDWYDMPTDVEKVAVCSLSGARATDACRHRVVVPDASTYEMLTASLTGDANDVEPVGPLPKAESSVYEDLFQIGSVPVETCWIHPTGPYVSDGVSMSDSAIMMPARASTPLVDDALKQHRPRPVGTTGMHTDPPRVMEAANGTKIVIQRVVGADGITRTVVRQIR
jgi:membrane peptidoglycan carboxypeptidase